MREYRIKRGHNADINALLTDYFGVKGDVLNGVEFEVPSIGKIMMRREKASLFIDIVPPK